MSSIAVAHDDRNAGGNVVARLLRLLGWHRDLPPPVEPPPVEPAPTVTPRAERQEIERRLQAGESRLAVLKAEAGLDELRTRPGMTDAR